MLLSKNIISQIEDAQKGSLMMSSEWSKDEKKTVHNFIDAVNNKNTAQQKDLEKKYSN